MSHDKRKQAARATMAETGTSYTAALREADRRHLAAKAADGALESLKANAAPSLPRESVPHFEIALPPLRFEEFTDAKADP